MMKSLRYPNYWITFALIILSSISTSILIVILNRQNYMSKDRKNLTEAFTYEQTYAYLWSPEIQEWTLGSPRGELGLEYNEVNDCVWANCRKREFKDRIINQLLMTDETQHVIKIKPPDYSYEVGQQFFLDEDCLVNRCLITHESEEANVLIFQNSDVTDENLVKNRRQDQIWIAYLLESPVNTFDKKFIRKHRGRHEFNWTASYRSDSDIVTPYSKFVPFNHKIQEYLYLKTIRSNNITEIKDHTLFIGPTETHRDILKSKTASVVWLASNCNTVNDRLSYAKELSKYIQVDIYGRCGNLTCHKWNQTGCLSMINTRYKFYLSFENSNCREYITEKLYLNAYGYNDHNHLIIPVVLGPTRKDYEEFAPPASFIHVEDFNSPKKLAEYLKLLESNEDLYYSYFQWKMVGRFIDTKFLCRVCAMAHHSLITGEFRSYRNIQKWWLSFGIDDEETTQAEISESCDIQTKLSSSDTS